MKSRRSLRRHVLPLAALSLVFSLGGDCGGGPAGTYKKLHAPSGTQLFASPQADPIALSPDGSLLFVANTTSGTISVIDTATRKVIQHRDAGLDPVSLAVRPDGKELWVANHVSDSVSVFDVEPLSATRWEIKHTIQDFAGGAGGVTTFDEPVGIAFASSAKAYVALSSRNEIAVIDIPGGYTISKRIAISAQDPRAIKVAAGKLFVAAFESGNRTELSACINTDGTDQCTLDINDLAQFATNPNLPAETKNIVVDPDVPDRDLFVFETTSENAILNAPLSGVGTLLYGLAVDSNGRVFVTHTDARNDVNGLEGQNLIDLQNVIFRNRVARYDCSQAGGGSCNPAGTLWALGPSPPAHPSPGQALATPYGIAVSGDDNTLVATAAGSHRIFTMNADDGTILGRLDVGKFPTGVALQSSGGGTGPAQTAYVLNAFDSTVSVVDVSTPSSPSIVGEPIPVGNDPTPENVRLGRIAFNDANASDSNSFSCGSCHPSGNTDQLLWRIGGACDVSFHPACGNDEPRTTMPIRGLKNTIPLHWDGTLGDPFGGGNGAFGSGGSGGMDCGEDPMDPQGDHACFLDLVDVSLAGVMCDQTGTCDAGGNKLSATERNNMAHFLAAVAYPPARERRIDDLVTVEGVNGFQDFFMDQNNGGNPDTCGDSDAGCHELPLGAATNSATLQGFDAPTMRGMTDRFLQFSLGPTAATELLVGAPPLINGVAGFPVVTGDFVYDPNVGLTEKATFGIAFAIFQPVYETVPDDIFQMFEEASPGTSGAVGRQVTLDLDAGTPEWDLLDELELADTRGVINLIGNGMYDGTYLTVSFDEDTSLYHVGTTEMDRVALEGAVNGGTLRVTLTGKLPENYKISSGFAQPLLGESLKNGITGDPDLPNVVTGDLDIVVSASDVLPNAVVLVDGDPEPGAVITCCGSVTGGGSCSGTAAYAPYCSTGEIEIALPLLPAPNGTHLIQIQNDKGALSNELPVCVGNNAGTCQDSN